jgi:protein-S-isoprenylcysteine O-methyltransferase Ste14
MLKNILLSLLGLVVIWFFSVSLPIWIAASEFEPFPLEIGSLRHIGWIPIILGASAILWCYWIFIFVGKGTPWPFDPPKKLVIMGLYRYVRNPMESSFFLVLFGEALLFECSAIGFYIIFSFLLLYTRQVLIEEPGLRRRFGKPYEQYCKSVPRYIPRLKACTRDG